MDPGNKKFLLRVWRDKPEDLEKPPQKYWEANITDAYEIPHVGSSLESYSGLTDYARYRVFDVRHNIGGALADLTIEGRSITKESKPPEGDEGLPLVLAYLD